MSGPSGGPGPVGNDASAIRFGPIVRLADLAVVGAETLAARPGATDGDLALRAGLALAAALGPGSSIPVATPLPAARLDDPACVVRLLEAAARARVAPSGVVLRVPEAALGETAPHRADRLVRLAAHGFVLAVDDVGSGWSGTSTLVQAPFAEWRIDARFVAAAPFDELARRVLESGVALARRLGAAVVAPGVDGVDAMALCRRLGVERIAGAAAGPPASLRRFVAIHGRPRRRALREDGRERLLESAA